MLKKFALSCIVFYQQRISPHMASSCRFRPSCSEYTYTAIERFGFFKGGFMGLWRILRCNPLSKGGYDPVPQRKEKSVKE